VNTGASWPGLAEAESRDERGDNQRVRNHAESLVRRTGTRRRTLKLASTADPFAGSCHPASLAWSAMRGGGWSAW
jgi:hypothetical protein